MKLPAIPFLTKTVSTEFFLALIFESDKISSILFKEQEKTLVIMASRESVIDLEGASIEDLIVACDNVISRLEMSLPEGTTLEKTIFAVPHSWVEEGRIKQARLSQLKKISEELALTPMGFIISIEAIVAFLQKKEGAPVNGIFVELSEKFLTIFVVRGGNIIDTKRGVISESVEKTVEALLSTVTKLDVLPSKIVLLHNKEAEAVQQKFLAHHWTKDLPFMHLPQVAILDKGFENEAIINGVATQLNIEVKGDVAVATFEEKGEDEDEVVQTTGSFGFLKDEDVATVVSKPQRESIREEDSGFEEDGREPIVKHHGVEQTEDASEEIFEEDEQPEEESTSDKKGISFASALSMFSGIITPRTFSNLPKMIGNGKKLIVPLIALIVVVLAIFLYYAFILKAQVIVFTDKKAFKEDSLNITLTTNGDSSFTDKTLKVSTIDEEVKGEEQQETTGQKDTGKKAQGTITIFNKTDKKQEIDKGTTVTSSNDLEFTLDDSISVASTSSFATSFSSEKVKVTASNFGKEYNLPSQTNFTIKGIATSDLFGRNDSAFSGGTKEEIQVVALKDLQALEDTVTKRLFDKAKSQATSQLSQDEALVPTYLAADFKDKTFDKKEDETAKNVKLTAVVDYTLGVYKKDELSKFISSSSNFDVPPEFKLSDAESSISISDIKQNKNDISAKLSFNAVFKPQLNTATLPQQISGKSQKDALSKLKSTPGISDATLIFSHKLPFLPIIVPLNRGNISIEIKSQGE
jgi:biopolymer transport protein ExbD